MSKRTRVLPPADNDAADSVNTRAEKNRRYLQRLFDNFPEQIDAIREKKETEAIELRRFMMRRERTGNKPVIKYSELKWTGSTSGTVG